MHPERTERTASPSASVDEGGPGAAGTVPDAPLLVLSFPRSGTTLLRTMLQGHPEMAVMPEPWWMVKLTKALRRETRPLTRGLATSYLAAHVATPWYAGAGLSLESIVSLLPDGPMQPAEVVSAIGMAYAHRFGKERWGAKDPGSEFRRALPLLHAAFPGATFVFLARDVRDVYLSQVGAGLRRGTEDLELYCFVWALQTRTILREFERMGERALILRYEDLLESPEDSLTRLCRAARLSTSPAVLEQMLNFQDQVQGRLRRNPIHRNLQGPVLAQNRRKFASQLSSEQIRRTEVLGGRMLQRLGYADPAARATIADRLPATAGLAPRLAINLWRSYLRKSTVTGMELRRRAGG